MASSDRNTLKFQAFLTAALLGVSALAAAGPAEAQYYGRGIMDERALFDSLQQRGFRRMTPPVLNRDVFVLDATDRRGRPVRLIVSAFDGRIIDAHPQRVTRWTRVDPDAEWDQDLFRQRGREREDIWRDERYRERQSRGADRDWHRDRWGVPQVDSDDGVPNVDNFGRTNELPGIRDVAPPETTQRPRKEPERVVVNPLPPPATARDPDLPAPTLKNPTIVKRSPTAIPKDPNEKPTTTAPAVSTAPKPKPGMGTRENPRVIELAPTPPPVTPPAASTPGAKPADAQRTATAPQASGRPAIPTPTSPPPEVMLRPPLPPEPASPSIDP